jgi:hypothetical protein
MFIAVGVAPEVGSFPQAGLDEALSLAVGLLPAIDTQGLAGMGEEMRAVETVMNTLCAISQHCQPKSSLPIPVAVIQHVSLASMIENKWVFDHFRIPPLR